MNIEDSPCVPIFLDDDDGIPAELPLMVTRRTLRSLSLSAECLKQFGSESDRNNKVTTPSDAQTS